MNKKYIILFSLIILFIVIIVGYFKVKNRFILSIAHDEINIIEKSIMEYVSKHKKYPSSLTLLNLPTSISHEKYIINGQIEYPVTDLNSTILLYEREAKHKIRYKSIRYKNKDLPTALVLFCDGSVETLSDRELKEELSASK